MNPATESPSLAQEAILFTDWNDSNEIETRLHLPNILLPIMGKSLLQRAIEQLVLQGCQHIHVILGSETEKLRNFLQMGERWGCRLSFHYLPPEDTLDTFMRSLGIRPDAHYWLADAARLPEFPIEPGESISTDTPLNWIKNSSRRWSGWGLFSGAWLVSRSTELRFSSLEESILNDALLTPRSTGMPLSVATPADVLETAQRLLARSESSFIDRSCHVHPSANIIAPVWIGKHVKIGKGATIGPNAIIGEASYVDEYTHLYSSVAMPDTYIGKDLELDQVIVRGSLLANITLNTVVRIDDPNLLAGMHDQAPSSWADSVFAFTLAVCLAPLQLALHLIVTHVDSNRWLKHFRDTFYPGLRDVCTGKKCLIGPSVAPPTTMGCTASSFNGLQDPVRPGLITDALFYDAPICDLDVELAGDLVASAQQGKLRLTMLQLRRYLGRVLSEFRFIRVRALDNNMLDSSLPPRKHAVGHPPAQFTTKGDSHEYRN